MDIKTEEAESHCVSCTVCELVTSKGCTEYHHVIPQVYCKTDYVIPLCRSCHDRVDNKYLFDDLEFLAYWYREFTGLSVGQKLFILKAISMTGHAMATVDKRRIEMESIF